MVYVSIDRAMLTSTSVVLACVLCIVTHRLRVGMAHVSERPETDQKTLVPFPQEVTVSSSPC